MSPPNHNSQTTHTQDADVKATAWLRQPNAVKRQSTLLMGARIRPAWLDKSMHLTQVRFQGPLAEALLNLQKAAKEAKDKNLPTVRLKALLLAKLDGVLRLDKYLGLGSNRAAIEVMSEDQTSDPEGDAALREDILRLLKRWNVDVVGEWATRNGLAAVAAQVGQAITAEGISITHIDAKLAAKPTEAALSSVEFELIARLLAERLVGEVLFEGLGPCEIVVNPVKRDHTVELMTSPTKSVGSDTVFSMTARLSVFTIPSSNDLLLKVQPVKRVWASKVPGRKFNAPTRFSCYIVAPGKPVMLGTVRRGQANTWEFDDDYVQYLVESAGALPETVADAVAKVMPDDQTGWWAGMPKLPTLFDRIGGRTVFETDEADLHDKVMDLLAGCVDRSLSFKPIKPVTQGPNSVVAMLRPTDLGLLPENLETGLVGASLFDENDEAAEAEETGNSVSTDVKRLQRIARHREANVLALRRIHADKPINLIVFGGTEQERKLIEACAKQLFDDAVTPTFEVLPANTHGLKSELEFADRKGKERFEARVARWEIAVTQLKDDGNPRHVLICAPKEINGRIEDPVNYYAGLHAICKHANANVHHLLPIGIDRRTNAPDLSNFVHRAQSALLDVFLAHSGAVLGSKPFAEKVLPNPLPTAIYGIQIVRSNARAMSNEDDVGFILYTRLVIETGVVQVRFAYCIGTRSQSTDWMPLNAGLVWLGQQRTIRGNSTWIRENFAAKTKEVLGELASSDPRAVVLIDWSTVQGSWKGLSDGDLLRSGPGVVKLEDVDLASACPNMTFVRLRADRDNTMSLRKRSTLLFEGWSSSSQTGDVFEESYPTTLKSIVEVHSGAASTGRPHFLLVMGYRKTVQILRGMSCFKTTQRMKPLAAKDANGKRFSLVAVPPSKDDAALPAGMEVTVLHHPTDVDPEDIARLVMGLRLGYAHYEEWTGLPAPLFFANKVRDYIVRYNSPEATLDDADGDGPGSPDDPDSPPDGPGGGAPDDQASESTEPTDATPSYLDDIATVVIPATVAAEASEHFSLAVSAPDTAEEEEQDDEGSDDEHVEEEAALDPQDPQIAKAFKLAKDVPSIYVRKGAIHERRIYEEILCGPSGRVAVELPWFATLETIVPAGVWPDKRGINSFWARQGSHGFRKRTGTAPAVGEFKAWFMNRLRIPQSLYSVDGYGFPPNQLFYRAIEVFDEFRKERERETGEPILDRNFHKYIDHFVRWLGAKESDGDIAWIILRLSHYPRLMRADRFIGQLTPEMMGPKSTAALQYFIDCCEVAIIVNDHRKGGVKSLPPLLRKAIHMAPPPSEVSSAPTQKTPMANAIERFTGVSAPTSQGSAPMEYSPSGQVVFSAPKPAGAPSEGSADAPITRQVDVTNAITKLLKELVPGHEDFPKAMEAIESSLAALRLEHEKALEQERAIAQRIAEIETQKNVIRARLDAASTLALQIASSLTSDLVAEAIEIAPLHEPSEVFDDDYLSTLEASLANVQVKLAVAIEANLHYLAVEDDQIPELQALSSIDRRRKKARLVAEATDQFDLAQQALASSIRSCAAFRPASQSAAAVEEDEGPPIAPEPATPDTQDIALETVCVAKASVQAFIVATPEPIVLPKIDQAQPAPVEAITAAPDPLVSAPTTEVAAFASDAAAVVTTYAEPPTTSPAETQAAIPESFVEDEATDDATLDPESLDRSLAPIIRCVSGRQWGLAQVGVRAFNAVFERPDFQIHTLSWSAMIQALAGLASNPSVDATFDAAFMECIFADPAEHPSATIASQLPTTIGVLGAGLLPMLFEGHGGSGRWAVLSHVRPRLAEHRPLLQLCEHIESIDSSSLVLGRETFSGAQVSVRQTLVVELERQRMRAARWQDDSSIHQNWGGSDYREMHRAMFDERQGLAFGKVLSLIGREAYDQARKLLPEVRKYRGKATAMLNELRKKAHRRRVVEGPGRDHFANNLEVTLNFIEGFFDLLDRTKDSTTPTLPSNLTTYLYTLYLRLQEASEYVKGLTRSGSPRHTAPQPVRRNSELDVAHDGRASAALRLRHRGTDAPAPAAFGT